MATYPQIKNQRIHDGFAQSRLRVLGQRFAPRSGDRLEPVGVAFDEAKATIDGCHQWAATLLARDGRPGTGAGTGAPHELHGGAADEIPWFGRKQDRRGAEHTRLQGCRCRDGHPQIGERSIQLIRSRGRTSVRGEDLVYRAEVEFGGACGGSSLAVAGGGG